MYTKIKNIKKIIFNNKIKTLIILCIIGFICTCIDATLNECDIFYYPEQEYRNLENEAYRMMYEKDFSTINKEYNFIITKYDDKSKELNMILKDGKNYRVNVEVYDYGKNNQYIKVRRNIETKESNNFLVILSLILATVIYSVFTGMIGMILFVLLKLIAYILDKIVSLYDKIKTHDKKKK